MSEEIKEIINDLQRVADRKCYPEDILDGSIAQEWADYITNLQEENERLKEENKRIFSKVNDDELLISNAMNYAEAQDYKSRCEKAIDKLYCWGEILDADFQQQMLEILQGSEK